ncbi:MAG TPA: HEPN domain-containing protein [Sedimentisphaerales bacterium]|nr:HEPN domain-containing protein [Sedimentisphaerales bacterium]
MNDDTGELVRQWKEKARNDWTAVEILLASEQCPAETVCFHCQQFVEKLLKALLTRYSIETPKTHDLRRLIQLAQSLAPELSALSEASDKLTIHGVETRYPGDWYPVPPAEMHEIVELSRRFSDILLPKLD